MMRCPQCAQALTAVGLFWVCPEHGIQSRTTDAPTVSPPDPEDYARLRLAQALPFPLALLISEYVREHNPFVKLHRLTDSAELLTRFAAMVVLSDIVRQHGTFSDGLRQALAEKLARPTFGAWKDLLASACQDIPQRHGRVTCFVAELPAYIRERLLPYLGVGEGDATQHIIALRNLLVHVGRLGDTQAQELLRQHQEPFATLIAALDFLTRYTLLACAADGRVLSLSGPPAADGAFPPCESPPTLPAGQPGRVLLAHAGDVLDLFPLHIFNDVFQWREETIERIADAAPQLYFRLNSKGYLEFTPLSQHAAFAQQRGPALERFHALFRLDEWRQLRAAAQGQREPLFDELLADLGDVFVGREDQVRQVKDCLSQRSSGVLWIAGQPGVGKSALMARLVRDYQNAPQHYVVIPYFFRQGHAGCSTDQFLRTALAYLHAALGEGVHAASTLGERRSRFVEALRQASERHRNKKVLLLVDGLDEIHRLEAGFVSLLFEAHGPRVVWVCAGRNEPPELETALRQGGARWVFPDGLPVMGEQAIRALLTAHLERLKYQFFARDEKTADRYHNRFVDVLVHKSAGLPLYVRMVIDDLRESKWTLDDEEKLPVGLKAYFEQILERLRVSDIGTVLTPLLCVLAWAQEPVTESALKRLLSSHHLSRVPHWEDLFRRALEHGHLMLRRTLTPEGATGWTFYHDTFRQHLGESPTVQNNYAWAQGAWLEYCQHWHQLEDPYPLRHFSSHLYAVGDYAGLIKLLQETDFVAVKTQRLADPFLAVQDMHYLTLALLRTQQDAAIIDLALTPHGYQRDGVALALRRAEPEIVPRIKAIVEALLQRQERSTLSGARRLLRLVRSTPTSLVTLNARKVALEVAYHLNFDEVLRRAATDPSEAVRAMLVPYLYRFWFKQREAGWRLLEQLSQRMIRLGGLPDRRVLEACGGMSLAILIYHFNDEHDPEVLARLRAQWQGSVRRVLHLRYLLKVAIFLLTRNLRWLMARQADYQPLNLRELLASYSRPSDGHRLGLQVLQDLAQPERGIAGTVDVLLRQATPYDVYLMLVAERTLVFHGALDPASVLDALYRLHREGCRWFRQSALYTAFHILRRVDRVEAAWLERYEQMTRETVQEARGTFTTGHGIYPLVPHMAWAEIIFDKHRSTGQARFISVFYQEAMRLSDLQYASRVLAACGILSLAYHRYDLALDALRGALTVPEPQLRDDVVQLLGNIRFYDEASVDQFVKQYAPADVQLRVAAATPTVHFSDLTTWVDDFFIHGMIDSATFRTEMVQAFERAGHACTPNELLQQVLRWVMSLIVGE